MKITETKMRRLIREELEYQEVQQQLLSEGLWDMLKSLTSGGMQSIKETIAKKLMEVLKFDTDSIMAKVFINFFGNLEMGDIKDMLMGDNKCITATGELAAAMTETIIEQIPVMIGVAPEGFMAKATQEALVEAFTADFNKQLAEAFCKIDYASVIEMLPGGSMISKFL